jgi:hypothetical protein
VLLPIRRDHPELSLFRCHLSIQNPYVAIWSPASGLPIRKQIYQAIEQELQHKARAKAFEKSCAKVELPDLEPKTVMDVKKQFKDSFGDGDVTIKTNKQEQSLAVEVALPNGALFSSDIKVRAVSPDEAEDPEGTLKFVPFPVRLPGDTELVWILAKRENMTPEEAAIALDKLQGDFWGSKAGQKLIRDRVERCFPEFVAQVPSGMLSEAGLKRHYREPEAIKTLQPSLTN